MNHHLPAMPPPNHNIPPSHPRRQQEYPYTPSPQGYRPQPPYLGYAYNPHMNPRFPPPQSPQHYYNWSAYPQIPQVPPPGQYSYTPLVVSSYPLPPPHVNLPRPPLAPVSTHSSEPSPIPPFEEQTVEPEDIIPVEEVTQIATEQSKPILAKVRNEPLLQGNFEPAFRAPVPWYSCPEQDFPKNTRRPKRKPKTPAALAYALELPFRHVNKDEVGQAAPTKVTVTATPELETPTTSQAPSESESTQPTTPSSAVPPAYSMQPKSIRPIVPAIPVIPILPLSPTTPRRAHRDSVTSKATLSPPILPSETTFSTEQLTRQPPPKSWADLVRSKIPASNVPMFGGITPANGLGSTKNEHLADVLHTMGADPIEDGGKIIFVEPRGLVNTGNMCYMNSVLQVLIFCIPFYSFLDRVGQRAAHKFKSDTPLIDAMIMFMREFRVIDAADSVEQLRLRMKQRELDLFGDPFTPEYVYQAIRQIPRFRDMRRGHQQDAQEFLGFLLEELHEECAHVLKSSTPSVASGSSTPKVDGVNGEQIPIEGAVEDGWMEVGHKQKAAITRSSGTVVTESPITRIFGGKIRSEWRVPGNKNSVTLEPYQSLQLDIGSPHVSNITDALRGLTRPENIQGDFNSARGAKSATKQVFLETLPPVLILHLKRFHYDNVNKTTQKIWKKVGYPLELEIPKEVFPQHRRGALAVHGGLPNYRLMGVIYHHGKNASGGHYTIDVRRQDGQEWIRLDDTVVRRVHSEEVAYGGSEEDPKLLAAALEKHKQEANLASNIYEQMEQDEQEKRDSERGWNQVNGTSSNTVRKPSGGANGATTPTLSSGKRTPNGRYSVKDNKVAYLLFYQKIRG